MNFNILSFNPLHKQLFQNTEARVSLGCQHPLANSSSPDILVFSLFSNCIKFTPTTHSVPDFFFSWILFSLGLGSSDRDRESEQLREKLKKGEKIQAAKS